MSEAVKVSATNFSRKFGQYNDEAHFAGVIEVTSHDRVIGGYLSARELAHYRRLKQEERQVLLFSEFDDDMLSELENTKWGVISE